MKPSGSLWRTIATEVWKERERKAFCGTWWWWAVVSWFSEPASAAPVREEGQEGVGEGGRAVVDRCRGGVGARCWWSEKRRVSFGSMDWGSSSECFRAFVGSAVELKVVEAACRRVGRRVPDLDILVGALVPPRALMFLKHSAPHGFV